MTSTDWYYSVDGQRVGPVSGEQLIELIQTRRLTSETLVWNSSMADWQAIISTEYAGLLRSSPGAAPTRTAAAAAPQRAAMTFSESISTCFSKYQTTTGRASRSEYWWFYLFYVLISWGIVVVVQTIPSGAELGGLLQGIVGIFMQIILMLVFFAPFIAVTCRRLHDTNRSGWWQLLLLTIIGIIPLLVWLASKGDSGENRFGPPLLV